MKVIDVEIDFRLKKLTFVFSKDSKVNSLLCRKYIGKRICHNTFQHSIKSGFDVRKVFDYIRYILNIETDHCVSEKVDDIDYTFRKYNEVQV